jgi:predicted metalloprotease with PDZ domain
MRYKISYQNPQLHFLSLTCQLDCAGETTKTLKLAAWRPGRYELQHYARNLRDFQVYDRHGNPVAFRKPDKNTWLIQTGGLDSITLHYHYYAAQPDAGGSWLDEDLLYVNFINCILWDTARPDAPYEVTLAIPETYQIATSLPVKGHTLYAQNYMALADAPVFASSNLQHKTYQVEGVDFHIWLYGRWIPDWAKLISQFKAFTQEQLDLFGEFPAVGYHFLIWVRTVPAYHGVEHAQSTVITLGPDEQMDTPALYDELLGISSHELFHAWNVAKIRPAELTPYDLNKEQYFPTGAVVEGVTTYYGEYLLCRCGVFSFDRYLMELNQLFKRHMENEGRHHASLTASSLDLWIDGYLPSAPGRKVSIYVKGALAALLLDWTLRLATHQEKSLDTLMRKMWELYGKTGVGYTMADYKALAEQVAGTRLDAYFSEVMEGTAPLEDLIAQMAPQFGLEVQAKGPANEWERFLGFKVQKENGIWQVAQIAPGSPAANTLALKDEILAIDGKKVTDNMQELCKQALSKKNDVRISLVRNNCLMECVLSTDNQEYFKILTIHQVRNTTPETAGNFTAWLT